MIFQATHQEVLDGTKTQTRRPVKPEEKGAMAGGPITYVETPKRLKWYVNGTYAVQPGRGKRSVGRIRITKIRRERLQEILSWDLIAEGFESELPIAGFGNLNRFKATWDSLYRKPYRWEDNPEVWILEFELVGQGKGGPSSMVGSLLPNGRRTPPQVKLS